jgi:nicotinamide-nucleotide amidase
MTSDPVVTEIVVIGSELIDGRRQDKNGGFLAKELAHLGVSVRRIALVPDTLDAIKQEISEILQRRPSILVLCGGLGPTSDDITKEIVASTLGMNLVTDEQALTNVRDRVASFRRDEASLSMAAEQGIRKQATVFENGRWFPNRVGVAVGVATTIDGTEVYLLPGPPRELQEMVVHEVVPDIQTRFRLEDRLVRLFRTAGLREVEVFGKVDPLMGISRGIDVSFLPSPGLVDVVLKAPAERGEQLAEKAGAIRSVLGTAVYAEEDIDLPTLVGRELERRCEFLVTAESCTAGGVARLITEIPGSSRYFLGGIVAYHNDIKQRLLGVRPEELEVYGAVSFEVAHAMARGARERLSSDWAISVTGIAGPEGGSEKKPVGLVYFGLACPDGTVTVSKRVLGGDRTSIRFASVRLALDLLRRGLFGSIEAEDG